MLVRCEDDAVRQSFQNEYTSYIETLPAECQAVVRRYGVVDFAMKVVGVGSVGTYCWVGLLEVFAVAECHFVDSDHKRLLEAIASKEIEAIDSEDP